MRLFQRRETVQEERETEVVDWLSDRDRRAWTSFYPLQSRERQRVEGWLLFLGICITIAAVFFVWNYMPDTSAKHLILAALGGLLGGLLQDAKFFYKSVGDGNWIWDKNWWRLLTPLSSAAMGFSVYAIFRGPFSGGSPSQAVSTTGMSVTSAMESYYCYGIGFLTGLFADNALQKLRDIAYTVFGTPKEPAHKLQPPKMEVEREIVKETVDVTDAPGGQDHNG